MPTSCNSHIGQTRCLKKLEIPRNRANGCPVSDQVPEPPTAIDFVHFRVLPLCPVLLAGGAPLPRQSDGFAMSTLPLLVMANYILLPGSRPIE